MQAMQQPMIPHRGPACAALFKRLQPTLRALFATTRPVYIAAASASGMMEAGARALPPGRVLALVNGAFSERYAKIAQVCGHLVERFEVPWGQVHEASEVAARLSGHDAVTLAHSETSTGALQPLEAIAAAVEGAALLVDTVSSYAATPIDFDRLGLAFTATGSQKALAVPPGLALGVASERFLESAATRSFYFDLHAFEKKQPPYTPALPQLYALDAEVMRIEAEGVAARHARHAAMAERTWAWAAEQGLEILAEEGHRSPAVTCLRAPAGLTGPEVVRRVAERGYVIGAGYGEMKRETFRIGHMGEQNLDTLEGVLAACADAIVVE